MRPNEIVAADITTDIQDMRDDRNVPHIVKELLDPLVSPSDTTRYAFMLCDSVKWELVGCLSVNAPVLKKTLPLTPSNPSNPSTAPDPPIPANPANPANPVNPVNLTSPADPATTSLRPSKP